MNNETLYETYKPLLNDLINKRDELNLSHVHIEISLSNDLGNKPSSDCKITAKGSNLDSKLEDIDKFRDYIAALNHPQIFDDIEENQGVGTIFPPVDNCPHLNSNNLTSFKHNEGEVTVVFVWKSSYIDSESPMAYNQKLLEEHPEWGKVRIVGFSYDENIQDLKKKVEDKKWNKIEHYQLQGSYGHPFGIKYVNKRLPCIFLIDKNGVVQFRGEIFEINLETAIERLLNDQSIENETMTFEEKVELCDVIGKFKDENKDLLPNKGFNIKIQLDKIVTNENIDTPLFIGSISVTATHESNTKDNINYFKTAIASLLANYPRFRTNINCYFKPHIIARVGTECLKCESKVDNNVPRYFCIECQLDNKDKFTFCTKCINDDEDFENNPIHEHVLYYLPPNAEDLLDKLMNIADKSKKVAFHPDKYVNMYVCNNCDNLIKIIDWSCAVCYKHVKGCFDLCNKCFKLNDNSYGEGKIKKHIEHDFKKHVMIRIPYNMTAYSEGFIKLD
jgi:hypothetical protein